MAFSASGTRDLLQTGNYLQNNRAESRYTIVTGILALPLAEGDEDGVPIELVRVHQPIRMRSYEYTAEKQQTPPLVPAPQDLTNETLLSAELGFPLPQITPANSNLIWQQRGTLNYVENGLWDSATGFKIGDYPFGPTPASIVSNGTAVTIDIRAPNTPGYGENLATYLPLFTTNQYADSSYDYNLHYPSRFFVEDLAEGN